MGAAQNLWSAALDSLVEGACKAVGLTAGSSLVAVSGFLVKHFSDHSLKIEQALRVANDRAWTALELALDGKSFWGRCQQALAQADQKAFAYQVHTFLDHVAPTELQGQPAEVRQACLRDLQAARKAGLLRLERLQPANLALQVSAFARFADPQQRAQQSFQLLTESAEEFGNQGYPHLAWLINLQVQQGASLLLVAMRYFFRREVEADAELHRGLQWASWESLAEAQQKGFACLNAALVQNGQRLEELLAGTHRVALDILAEVQGQREHVQQIAGVLQELLAERKLANRELRPRDSFSIHTASERNQTKQLLAWYRGLPQEQQAQLPAVLNGLGKLQHAAGEFPAAQAIFTEVAQVARDGDARAEAHHNAYLAALEQRNWSEALSTLKKASELAPARFQPFDLDNFEPLQILGAGGFGVAFLCRHRISGGLRVLKTLRAESLSREAVEQLEQEARHMEELNHPAIIRLFDCRYADSARTRLYLVTEYFNGVTLADYVNQCGTLLHWELKKLAQLLAEGLQEAHEHGIIHRDIKPVNILVKKSQDGWEVKIIDFGLALKAAPPAQAAASTPSPQCAVTIASGVAGTLDYAAPEQLGRLPGVPVGQRSDVYGFGRTCCYALFKTPHPLGKHWKALPGKMRDWLDSCLEESPELRPASFTAVLDGLSDLRVAKPAVAPVLVVLRGVKVSAEYPLEEGKNTLGRDGADVNLAEQEAADPSYIAPEHCLIHVQRGKVLLEDANSPNGTYLNRVRVNPGEKPQLKADDLIQLGAVTLKVRM